MTTTRLFPGMCDDSLEIFFHSEEQQLKAIVNGQVKCFSDVLPERKAFLKQIISSEDDLANILNIMHPENET